MLLAFPVPGLRREEVPERGAAPRSRPDPRLAGVGMMGLALAPMRLLGKRTLPAPWCPGTGRARRICLFCVAYSEHFLCRAGWSPCFLSFILPFFSGGRGE